MRMHKVAPLREKNSKIFYPTSKYTVFRCIPPPLDRDTQRDVLFQWPLHGPGMHSSVRTSSTYLAFRRQLKTLLFKASFEDRT